IFRVEKVQNLAELLSETAVGFVPSIGSEVICRVAEEFLLCGTPVVAHDVGSLSECAFGNFGDSYRDEEMGGLQLAAWLRRSMGESAHEKAQRSADAARSFSLDSMADNLVEVARKVLS